MRLTLRTLLAWLDDTLPPAEVRQIGQQVAETQLAQDLVNKIQRVTRQRRLTVPPSAGHDAVDANVVADYLADSLSPEMVTEYEKKCLTSDVHLAEVASVHQILSLLAQKAKVPPEAKQRMYHLFKGRETVAAAPAAPRVLPPPARHEPKPVLSSFASYSPPPLPRRSAVERYGPLAAVLALIAILSWSAWMSVGGANNPPAPDLAIAAKGKDRPVPPAPPKADLVAAKAKADAEGKKAAEAEAAATKAEAETKDASRVEAAKVADLPSGSAGVVGPGEAVLLRYNADSRAWDRLVAGATLRDGDRVVNLPPFRAPLKIGSADVTMIGDGEITVLAPGAGASGRFALNRGRVRIAGSSAVDPVVVPFEGVFLKLTAPSGSTAGLERIATRYAGEKVPAAPSLRVFSAAGPVTAECGSATEMLASGSSSVFHAPNVFAAKVEEATPGWLADANPGASEQDRASRMAKYFKADRSPIVCLVEAAEDERDEVRRDAVTALGSIGPPDLLVATLSKKDDPASRKAAISVLRDIARRDPESAVALRAELEKFGGSKDWADIVEGLLVGPSSRDASDEAYQAKLVALLKHEDVGVRELAIEVLQAISRRGDRLGYDPDKPGDTSGYKAWHDLVIRHELRGPAAPKAK